MSSYTGITIGPIFDTITLAHSPAAMWYASFMFSTLTEQICSRVPNQENIISPYYDGTKYDDGIGRYHDRIVLKDISSEDAKKIVDESKEYIANTVADDLGKSGNKEIIDFVKDYLQIHIVHLPEIDDEKNPILEIGNKLNLLELMKSATPDNSNNPFFELFKGKNFRNEYVRKRVNDIDPHSQLKKGNTLRSIPDIASMRPKDERTMKREFYYAVVEADGDRMGDYINSLKKDDLRAFSGRCLKCASDSAKSIGSYGGMTVYAGGDDLLFLAPVYNEASSLKSDNGDAVTNIYELCEFLSKKFTANISEGGEIPGSAPTLSFGIAVRREGFPLYEAINSAIRALHDAKDIKNAMLVDFEKGSGQAIRLIVPFGNFKCFDSVFRLYDASSDNLKSAIYAIEKSRVLFKLALAEPKTAENVIRNTFDNEAQKEHSDFLDKYIASFNDFMKNGKNIRVLDTGRIGDDSDEHKRLIAFESVLRLSKFMLEKKGDK